MQRHRLSPVGLALLLGVAAGCRPSPSHVPDSLGAGPVRLAFLHDFNAPHAAAEHADPVAVHWGAAGLGGLSGLSFDARSGTLYAVSDDCAHGPPRIYAFGVALTPSELRILPRSVLLLRDTRGSGLLDYCDSESITSDGSGGFFIGTENHDAEPGMRWPSILRVTRAGLISGSVPLPEAFLPSRTESRRAARVRTWPSRGSRAHRAVAGSPPSPRRRCDRTGRSPPSIEARRCGCCAGISRCRGPPQSFATRRNPSRDLRAAMPRSSTTASPSC